MVGVEVRTMATPENQSLAGEKMAIRIDAVSYTHLDVYKRQQFVLSFDGLGF